MFSPKLLSNTIEPPKYMVSLREDCVYSSCCTKDNIQLELLLSHLKS